jgi:hypothetical protein
MCVDLPPFVSYSTRRRNKKRRLTFLSSLLLLLTPTLPAPTPIPSPALPLLLPRIRSHNLLSIQTAQIVLGSWQDNGLWNTGNGWAAAGMIRVAATIMNGPYATELASQAVDLQEWTAEVLVAAFKHIKVRPYFPLCSLILCR